MILEAAADGVTLPGWAVTLLVPSMIGLVAIFFRWQQAQDRALHKLELHIANESASKEDLKSLEKIVRKVLQAVTRLEGQHGTGRRRQDRGLMEDLDDDDDG